MKESGKPRARARPATELEAFHTRQGVEILPAELLSLVNAGAPHERTRSIQLTVKRLHEDRTREGTAFQIAVKATADDGYGGAVTTGAADVFSLKTKKG